MPETTIEAIKRLLETSIEETDDQDTQFKLEQALELVTSVEQERVETDETLQEAEIRPTVEENLKALGYL